jgi:hypothetical protein
LRSPPGPLTNSKALNAPKTWFASFGVKFKMKTPRPCSLPK